MDRSTLIAVISALALSATGVVWWQNSSPLEGPLAARSVVEYTVISNEVQGQESVVRYEYLGDPLPQKLVVDEEITKRTENSYTRYLGTVEDDAGNHVNKYEAVIFQDTPYVKEGGKWYYRQSATTTASAFYKTRPLLALKDAAGVAVAYAATYTGFSTTGDGYFGSSGIGNGIDGALTFDNCLSGIYGENDLLGGDFSATTMLVTAAYRNISNGTCSINRAFLPFDTSTVPSGSTVSAATLAVWVTAKSNGVNDGTDTVGVYDAGGADFFDFGSTIGSDTLDITSISTAATSTFTLTSTGYTFLTLGGTTSIGIRESHDPAGSISSSVNGNSVTMSTAESTGQDPVLTITYTARSTAFWQFQDF